LSSAYTPQQKTAFDKVVVHAKLGNGKVNNDRLLLDSNLLKVKGSGVIDIMNNSLDEKVFVQLDAGSAGSTANEILKHPIGVHLHGPFAGVATDLDYSSLEHAITAMLKAKAKTRLKEKADALKAQEQAKIDAQKKKLAEEKAKKEAELKQKAKDSVKDKLKGLFGR
jgi:AsmA protein